MSAIHSGRQLSELFVRLGRALLKAVGFIVNLVRWGTYGVLALLERPIMWGLSAVALVLVALCLFYALVHPGHFPFAMTIGLIGCCGLAAVGYYALMALLAPSGSRADRGS